MTIATRQPNRKRSITKKLEKLLVEPEILDLVINLMERDPDSWEFMKCGYSEYPHWNYKCKFKVYLSGTVSYKDVKIKFNWGRKKRLKKAIETLAKETVLRALERETM